MYRLALKDLYKWKNKLNKKPMIIQGARQVGKTWLMKEFAKEAYQDFYYLNFDNNQTIKSLFENNIDIERIILGLELYFGKKIDPHTSLLIFDEIQEVPKALSSLKYFNENAPEYQIICAGSLLGIALHQGTSFPVGKVEFLELYPLSFLEFLQALDKEHYVKLLLSNDFSMLNDFKHDYIELLKYYYLVGGMPEVVNSFVENKDFNEVRKIQESILMSYEQDFSKHAPNEIVPRIRMLWESIPSQLAKENKKFIYGLIKEGSRAKEYELALLWLSDCGLVHKVQKTSVPNLPLKAYEDLKSFKLFVLDLGLLSCMVRLNPKTVINGNEVFKEFKGALTEQFVLQQLKTLANINIYYWTNDKASAEIDFLIDNGQVIPIEVKAEINLQAKSLQVYREKYKPKLAVRCSMADYKKVDELVDLPLYAISQINSLS